MTLPPSDIKSRLRTPVEKLTVRLSESELGFDTTREVPPLEGTIGQDRALRALEFGLGVEQRGFNIFVSGAPGTGRSTTLRALLRQTAARRPVPNDWVYVHSFADPKRPRGISLPAGMGRQLANDMDELVSEARVRVPRAFESKEYERRVEEALAGVQQRQRAINERMVEEASRRGMSLRMSDAGIVAVPLGPTGEPMSREELNALSSEEAQEAQKRQEELQGLITQQIGEMRQTEREANRVRSAVNREVAEFALRPLFAEMREYYGEHGEAVQYLREVREDMLSGIQIFVGARDGAPAPELAQAEAALLRYRVNVFVDHSRTNGAPVVFEQSPTHYNVFGRADHAFRNGAMMTDFTEVHPGSLHRANGGFLVFHAKDLLAVPGLWQSLKQALQSGEARIESLGEQIALVPTTSIEPEPVPLDVKVVLIGNPHLARTLLLYDEDFPKLFKVKADFSTEIELNAENIRRYASFVVNRIQEDGLLPFDASGVARVIEQSARFVEDQERLSARFADVADLVIEASFWARQVGSDMVTREHVQAAVDEARSRSNRIEERLQDLYDEGTIRVEVDGRVVGQINGLAVIDMGDYSFGRPSRLTARVALGRGELANVEQASQMSGRIHSKGFQILMGYLMGKYGLDATLPMRASIAFEQTYEEVDGDSASSTELYALLSSLANVPIDQGLAVTGSIDQQGQVQAIGGATRKIEGFFEVCKARGLTGRQGVLIPASNVRNLVLNDEVVDAVREGLFNVYAVETVEQGVELLMGAPAGEQDEDGHYPEGSINSLVMATLAQMDERLREPARRSREPKEPGPPVDIASGEERDRDRREGPGEPPSPPPD